MSNSLTRFNNQVTASHSVDLSPQMESGLRQMTFKIAELQQTAEVARRESSDDSSLTPTTSGPSSEGGEILTLRSRGSQEALIGPTPSTTQHTTAGQTDDDDSVTHQDLPFGYRISYEPTATTNTTSHDDITDITDITTTTTTTAAETTPILLPLLPTLQPLLPSPTTLSPQPPYTYSFHEITFARQLERACLERGIYVLANVHLEPAAYRRAFRISRHFSSPELMLRRLKSWLQKSVMRPYGDLRLNLGGAGVHYASQPPGSSGGGGLRAGEEYRKSARARLVAMGLPITAEVEADLRFYEGVWFDMRDVEAYLAELGIRVEPYASVVEARTETLQWLWQDVGVLDGGGHGNVGRIFDRFPAGWNASQSESRSSAVDSSVGFLGATADVNARVTDELSTEEWERFCNSTVPWLSDVVLGEAPANGAGDSRDVLKKMGERITIDVQRLANGMVTCPISAIGMILTSLHQN
ncbi:hypothetical protein DIS24_g11786 [Lasiodiplodia hormozganensis]|uniref:Uncharacterized protein n=1 Tax=Lasiodiplodia hormozganensis TaxID=869390 RepID=A0AA40BVS7_9PEZI|nr:hypothetical protein DIS24_g11786 [Lasiodiplodia hormozganensis]